MEARRRKLVEEPGAVRNDLLTLLLEAEGKDGLTAAEIEDNLITFIGAGHETTARALGWTLYCLANAPQDYAVVRDENGQPVRSASAVPSGAALAIELADGTLDAVAVAVSDSAGPKPVKPKKSGAMKEPPKDQGSLF